MGVALALEPLVPFGAIVHGAAFDQRSPDLVAAVRSAVEAHQLLIFRGHAPLSDEQLLALARNFGYIERSAIAPDRTRPGFPEIYVVSNALRDGKAIGIGRGAGFLNWHTDLSFEPRISSFGFLEAVEVPAGGGGETMFTNMYMVYEQLPEAARERLSGLRATHESDAAYSVGKLSEGRLIEGVLEKRADDHAIMRADHPAVLTNPDTGRRAVYLNPQNVSMLDGVSEEESADLLALVFDHLGHPDFTVEHTWQPGDLAVYDQLGTNHARRAFDGGAIRYMRQITVQVTDLDAPWRAVTGTAHARGFDAPPPTHA